eukprot:1608796-Karenia_brevis.AAC.1
MSVPTWTDVAMSSKVADQTPHRCTLKMNWDGPRKCAGMDLENVLGSTRKMYWDGLTNRTVIDT